MVQENSGRTVGAMCCVCMCVCVGVTQSGGGQGITVWCEARVHWLQNIGGVKIQEASGVGVWYVCVQLQQFLSCECAELTAERRGRLGGSVELWGHSFL